MFGLVATSTKSEWHRDFVKLQSVVFTKNMMVDHDFANLAANPNMHQVKSKEALSAIQ